MHESEIPSVKMWLVKSKQSPPRRYNLPNSNEIAIVFRSQDGEPRFEKDIAIHPVKGGVQRLNESSEHTDPMCYPLIYPIGGLGWSYIIPLALKTGQAR